MAYSIPTKFFRLLSFLKIEVILKYDWRMNVEIFLFILDVFLDLWKPKPIYEEIILESDTQKV